MKATEGHPAAQFYRLYRIELEVMVVDRGRLVADPSPTDAECEPRRGLPGSGRELSAPPTVEEAKREYAECLAVQAGRRSPD